MTDPNAEATGAFDMDSAVEAIGADLGFDTSGNEADDDEADDDSATDEGADDAADDESDGEVDAGESDETDEAATEASAKTAAKPDETAQAQATNIVREPPKSWAKDTHAHWATLKPEVQEYIHKRETQFLDGLEQYKTAAQYAKTVDSVVAPYRQILQSQKLAEPQAIASLLRAHVALTTGAPESRRAAFEQLAKNMGYDPATLGNGQPPPPPTPYEQELQRRLDALESERVQQREAAEAQLRAETDALVETFAADTAHSYFNEVAHDMRTFVNAGMELDAAYDAAVWSNKVTRAKEIASLETQWKADYEKNAKARVEAARRNTSSNVRAVESSRAPTEPKGKFLSQSAMEADLKAIRARTQ